jgi:hypothetical protein
MAPWDATAGMTPTDRWLGRSQPQRAQTLLALALATLLLLGALAALVMSIRYEFTHIPGCSMANCPPSFSYLLMIPLNWLGVVVFFLSLMLRITWIERRCGVWFRGRGGNPLGAYIRRPAVTPEAAATALQRYASGSRPVAQFLLFMEFFFILFCLLFIGGALLSTWISTQWIPK